MAESIEIDFKTKKVVSSSSSKSGKASASGDLMRVERKQLIGMAFAENISDVLLRASVTQAEVVRRLKDYYVANNVMNGDKIKEIGPWDFSRWKRGVEPPTVDEVLAVAAVLEMDPNEIVPGVTALSDKTSVMITTSELSNGRVYVELRGEIDWESYAKIITAVSEARVRAA